MYTFSKKTCVYHIYIKTTTRKHQLDSLWSDGGQTKSYQIDVSIIVSFMKPTFMS